MSIIDFRALDLIDVFNKGAFKKEDKIMNKFHLEMNDDKELLLLDYERINQEYKDSIVRAEKVARSKLKCLLRANPGLVPYGYEYLCWEEKGCIYDIGAKGRQFDSLRSLLVNPFPLQSLFRDKSAS